MKLVVLAGALALALVPGTALATGQPENPGSQGQEHANEHATPGPHATLPAKAKAYGHYCNEESRKHVAGEPGTPFSKCVTAAARVAVGVQDPDENDASPAQAC